MFICERGSAFFGRFSSHRQERECHPAFRNDVDGPLLAIQAICQLLAGQLVPYWLPTGSPLASQWLSTSLLLSRD